MQRLRNEQSCSVNPRPGSLSDFALSQSTFLPSEQEEEQLTRAEGLDLGDMGAAQELQQGMR